MGNSQEDFQRRLEQAKLDAMKELAYGASHEINNPLANISARAQTLLRDERDPERRRALEAIHQQALRAHEMISDLMLFARPPQLQRQPVDLGAVARLVVDELAPECAQREIAILALAEERLPMIDGDPTQLEVALKALCTNAVEAIGYNGRIEVRVSPAGATGGVSLTISDDGPGVPAEIRSRLFDPFFSGREAGRGLGFGLSKAWRIVAQHGGTIAVESPAEGGACFVVDLPTAGDELSYQPLRCS